MSLKYLAILFLCITSVLCSRPQRTFATNALQSDTWMDTPMQHVWSLSNSFNTFAGQVRDVLTARSIKEDARATKMNSIQLQQDLAKVQQKLSVTQLELENVRQQLKTVQSICKPSPAITSPYFAFFKDFNSVLGVGKCFKKETKGVCAIVAVFEGMYHVSSLTYPCLLIRAGLKYIARSRALVDNKALAAIAAGKQPENRQVTYASAVRARAGQYMDSVTSIRPKINSMFRFVGNQSKLALIKQSLLEAEERADVAELLLERTQARLEDAEAKLASDGQSLVAALCKL